MLTNGKKVYAIFMDLEQPCNIINHTAMRDELKEFVLVGRLVNGVKAFL